MTAILIRHHRFLVCLLMFFNLGLATTFFAPGGSPVDSLWVMSSAALYVTVTILLCLSDCDTPAVSSDSAVESPFTILPSPNDQPCRQCELRQRRIDALQHNSRSLERWNRVLRHQMDRLSREMEDDGHDADWWKRGEDSPI